MTLSYLINPFTGGRGAIDLMSWAGCNYQVVRATKKERESLISIGLL